MAGFRTGKSHSSKSPFIGTRTLPPIDSTSDRKFFDSLQKYIPYQKKRLNHPSEGPDEQRYDDKVIERRAAPKMFLPAIDKECDDCISSVKRREYEERRTQRRLRAKAGDPTAVMYYKMRAAQLQERIALIEKNTAQIHAELRGLQERRRERRPSQPKPSDSKDLPPTAAIPGLTLQESADLATLRTYLERLKWKLADLREKRRSQCASEPTMADTGGEMRRALGRRDKLAAENLRLELRHRKMAFLYEAFRSWQRSEGAVPLSEILPSILEEISHFKVSDADYLDVITGASEEEDPAEAKESKLLSDYAERFTLLLDGGEYLAATLHAARSPHGILRNMATMDRFKAVGRCDGARPPALLYFQALMMAVPVGQRLPGEGMAAEGVGVALRSGGLEQVVHWVTQHRLTFSEVLGDVLSAHAQEDAATAAAADTCLALAQMVYEACEHHSKAAVCMSRRGFIHRSVEYIHSNGAFTANDCLYVVRSCPSVALLQALTQELQGQPAPLSLGWAACSLMDTGCEELVYQLLESMQACGALGEAVRRDRAYAVEDWSRIAERCREMGCLQLAQAVGSTLAPLRGATQPPPVAESTGPGGPWDCRVFTLKSAADSPPESQGRRVNHPAFMISEALRSSRQQQALQAPQDQDP